MGGGRYGGGSRRGDVGVTKSGVDMGEPGIPGEKFNVGDDKSRVG